MKEIELAQIVRAFIFSEKILAFLIKFDFSCDHFSRGN